MPETISYLVKRISHIVYRETYLVSYDIMVGDGGESNKKNKYQKSRCKNDRCGEGNLMGGPEEISAGGDDVFGWDFFDDGFVFVVVVGNRGAAQQ